MRFLVDQASYDQLMSRTDHTKDCYVRPGEYLHHMYVDGIKYVVARALYQCINEAKAKNDVEALAHLQIHEEDLRRLVADAQAHGGLNGVHILGAPLPDDTGKPTHVNSVRHQTIKDVVVTRRNIRQAFSDLIMSEAILNEVGPAVNSASSIFLF